MSMEHGLELIEDLDWQRDGNCVGMNPEIFFPPEPKINPILASRNYAVARATCQACVVKDECQEYAIRTKPKRGIWGGKNSGELREIRHERAKAIARLSLELS